MTKTLPYPDLVLYLQPGIHAHDTPDQIPVVVGANPVSHDNASASRADAELVGALALLAVANAEILNDGRVHLGGNGAPASTRR